MTAIESRIALPRSAEPLSAYGRYYRYDERGKVAAVYLIPTPPDDIGGCSVLTETDMRDCTAGEVEAMRIKEAASAARQLAAGERRWIRKARDIPEIFDGGCSQINILYDAEAHSFIYVACNGDT